jgi:hypothetical protein
MSEPSGSTKTGIKRLEKKRKGKLWGLLKKSEALGIVIPLKPESMVLRLRNLMTSSIKTTSIFIRNTMGETGLQNLFEYQGVQYTPRWTKWKPRADQIARTMIKLNFQPLGIDAEFTGDEDNAKITVNDCPIPERFLQDPELLIEYAPAIKPILKSFSDNLDTSKEFRERIKSVEACSTCRIITPKVGKELGFEWEPDLTDDDPTTCQFNIRVNKKGN